MNRPQTVERILSNFRTEDHELIRRMCAYLSDTNLMAYAEEIESIPFRVRS